MSPAVGPRFAPPVPQGYKVFTSFEQNIAKALSLTIFPPGGAIAPSGEDVGVSRFLDSGLSEFPVSLRFGLRALLLALEFAPLIFMLKFARFSRMNDADRERYLGMWQGHGFFWIRAAIIMLKSICCLSYYADERVREAIGFYVVCVNGKRRQDI